MIKNYMVDVAKMLGVELGEEFHIEGFACNPYMFTEDGLTDNSGFRPNSSLGLLLLGKAKIIKRPWKPKERDIYYYINTDGTISHKIFCSKSEVDLANVLLGNFFKTAGEAEVNSKKWLERIKHEPDFSWRVDNETR